MPADPVTVPAWPRTVCTHGGRLHLTAAGGQPIPLQAIKAQAVRRAHRLRRDAEQDAGRALLDGVRAAWRALSGAARTAAGAELSGRATPRTAARSR